MLPVSYYVTLSAALFALGLYGITSQRSALRILISVELVLNAATINFVAFANFHSDPNGLAFTLFIIALAAAEAAVGLAIMIHIYRHLRTVDVDQATALRW